jgi:hypothetical protein
MNSLPETNIIQLPQPSSFLSTIETLNQQFAPILDDYKKYYVFHNMVPDYNEYQQMFETINSNLNEVTTKLFTTTNDIEVNIEKISKKLKTLSGLINKEKEKNNTLRSRLEMIDGKNNSADILINNYKEMYNIKYIRNWGLVIGIVLSIIASTRIFKKPLTTNMTL